MGTIVRAEGLSKTFRRPVKSPGLAGALRHLVRGQFTTVEALTDVSLSIDAGESVAYVGPNGAGKSTTIKLLTGILVPTAGSVDVCGLTPHRDRVANARNISVLFGQRTQLWWDIPVIESLRLLADIFEVPAERYRATMDELIDVLDLAPLLTVPARQLSLGQRMRCDLAASLVHDPKVLFLDEPTIGLDVSVKAKLREFVGRMVTERGLTLMLTSHDLGDIEHLCPRMVMIDRGRVVHDGPLAEIARRFAWEQRVVVTLADDDPDESAAEAVRRALGERATGVVGGDERQLAISFDSRLATAGEVVSAVAQVVTIADLSVEPTSTEAIVRQLYEGGLSFDDGHSAPGGKTADE
ncbi:ABC transporter ATP-binding protein [Aestuariimicrobium soli]|uniref:ABC transporter ATP-binding protein n=1 Tax=Aestuariimicrobium soli TaxID=2035834 RepID=UPI003EBEB830